MLALIILRTPYTTNVLTGKIIISLLVLLGGLCDTSQLSYINGVRRNRDKGRNQNFIALVHQLQGDMVMGCKHPLHSH